MANLEDRISDLSADEKRELISIVNNSLNANELGVLREQLESAKTIPERVALKQRIHDLTGQENR